MNYEISSSQKIQKAISPEQFEQVIAAITNGEYSWACVLVLRFIDYNPLHFIPQRTYSRLMKKKYIRIIKDNKSVPNSSISTTRLSS